MNQTLKTDILSLKQHHREQSLPLGKSKDGNQTGGREAYMRNQKNNNGSGSFEE